MGTGGDGFGFHAHGSYAKSIVSDILFVFEACWTSINVKQRFGRQTKLGFIGVQRLLSVNTEDEPDSMKESVQRMQILTFNKRLQVNSGAHQSAQDQKRLASVKFCSISDWFHLSHSSDPCDVSRPLRMQGTP